MNITTNASSIPNGPVTSNPSPAPAPAPTPVDLLADATVKALDTMESSLNLDIVIRPNDKSQMRALSRISVEALGLAATIATSDPARFSDFQSIPPAADYAAAMGRVAARVTRLATHLQKSIQNQRYPASEQVLALYKVVKALAAISDNEVMREAVPLLAAELAPKHKTPKPKETAAQKSAKRAAAALAKKVATATAFLAANPPPATAPPKPATSPTPAASPAANGAAASTAATLPVIPAAH